jgi:hypothetical protein
MSAAICRVSGKAKQLPSPGSRFALATLSLLRGVQGKNPREQLTITDNPRTSWMPSDFASGRRCLLPLAPQSGERVPERSEGGLRNTDGVLQVILEALEKGT